MRSRLVIFLVLAMLPPCVAAPTPMLANDGTSPFRIAVAPNALPITRRAAEDLQLYLQRSTGARLPISATAGVPDGPAIVVGSGAAAKAAGIDVDSLPPEGFRLLTKGNILYIVGRDTNGSADSVHWRFAPQAGTWNGVCTFLENQLGIRWFFPGESGEYVPHHDRLPLPQLDETGAPRMIYRRMSYLWQNSTPEPWKHQVLDWMRHNRLGWSIVWNASHSWLNYFRAKDYYDQHPEWFALVDGRRVRDAPHGAKMCTTNPGALDRYAKKAIEYGRENPGVMFSLSPNDGGGDCQCPTCTALDAGHWPDGHPILTDRYVTYCNEVAKRVNKVLPDQTFGFYAYSWYALPPRRVKHLDPHVYVMEVMNDTDLVYHIPKVRHDHLQLRLKPWKNLAGRLFFYATPDGMGNMGLPVMSARAISLLFQNLEKAGVTGISMNNGASFASSGLNNYLYAQLSWNPAADAQRVYEDALPLCYGPGADNVKAYFDMVEARQAAYAREAYSNLNRGIGSVRRFPGMLEDVYPGLEKAGMPLLKQALTATHDPGQRARINMLIDNLKFAELTVLAYRKAAAVLAASKPSLEEILAARDLVEKREAYLKRHHDDSQLHAAAAVATAKSYNLPLSSGIFEYLLTRARAKPSVADVSRTAEPPEIDARLDDPVWTHAASLNANLDKDNAAPSKISTVAHLAYDNERLYLAVDCREPLISQVADTVTKRDGPVWNENEIELFLDPANRQEAFCQLVLNTLGTICDVRHTTDGQEDWDARATVATRKTPNGWICELSIPFSAIGVEPPQPGDIWGLNICRVRAIAKPREYTCWSPTFGGFLNPGRFGKLVFH